MNQKGFAPVLVLLVLFVVGGIAIWYVNREFSRTRPQSRFSEPAPFLTPHSTEGPMQESPLKACDLNADGRVDKADLTIFNTTFGKCLGNSAYNREADFFRDGCVDVGDRQVCLSQVKN